jgi:hypothetical protein
VWSKGIGAMSNGKGLDIPWSSNNNGATVCNGAPTIGTCSATGLRAPARTETRFEPLRTKYR